MHRLDGRSLGDDTNAEPISVRVRFQFGHQIGFLKSVRNGREGHTMRNPYGATLSGGHALGMDEARRNAAGAATAYRCGAVAVSSANEWMRSHGCPTR